MRRLVWTVFGPAVEVVGPEIVVEGAMLEHMVGRSEDRDGEGSDRLFRRVGSAGDGTAPGDSCRFAGGRQARWIRVALPQGAPSPSRSGLHTSFDDKREQVVHEMASCLAN